MKSQRIIFIQPNSSTLRVLEVAGIIISGGIIVLTLSFYIWQCLNHIQIYSAGVLILSAYLYTVDIELN